MVIKKPNESIFYEIWGGKIYGRLNKYPATWLLKSGKCFIHNERAEKHDLIPLKRPWYEDESNFLCIIYNIITNRLETIYETSPILKNDYRPATPKEALNLVVKDK